MFKSFSFDEAFDFMLRSTVAVTELEAHMGEAGMEMIHDAVNFIAQTPELHGCPEDYDMAVLFSLALSRAGYNHFKSDHDVTRQLMTPARDA